MKNLQIRLSPDEWALRIQQHLKLVQPFTDSFLKRRAIGIKHPVHDFLFTYYNCSPLKLKQWVPSINEGLMIDGSFKDLYPWFNTYWFKYDNELVSLNRDRIPKNTFGLAKFISELCDNISQKAPRFTCFGLHEWAMVYKASPESIRHQGYRLRISPEKLAFFVENQAICCSHYDAFRFFSKEAIPFNTLNPKLETRLTMEQGGCLHANMDLYKWSTKLWPWIGSDFIAKTFLLAIEARELDMRASPYDLENEGYPPICIETEEGRQEYQHQQKKIAEKSVKLRDALRKFCEKIFFNLTLQNLNQ